MSTVSAELIYFSPPPDGSRPFTSINADAKTGQHARNWIPEAHTVEIENVRGKEINYTLDTAGFQYHTKPSKHTTFVDDEEIRGEYYPESIELIKEVTGASKVVLFDHTVRRHRPGDPDSETGEGKRQPVAQVHIDQTPDSAIARVHRHLPAVEAEKLVKKRFQIVNLWRPISHPAIDNPLAVCDYRSVDVKRDLIPVTLVFPDHEGETFGVKFNPSHKWKYKREMKQDEVVFIKCYDSAEDVAVFTPHTGFKDPSAPPGAPLRESIELRALVFYE